jgi:hypothetical protein
LTHVPQVSRQALLVSIAAHSASLRHCRVRSMTRSSRRLEMRCRRSHIGSQLGTQTLNAQSSHEGQLDTHWQRSPV